MSCGRWQEPFIETLLLRTAKQFQLINSCTSTICPPFFHFLVQNLLVNVLIDVYSYPHRKVLYEPYFLRGRRKKTAIKYICSMTGRAIRGNIPLTVSAQPKGGTIPRLSTEFSPFFPTRGIAMIHLLYNFHVDIGTGNNNREIWKNIAL